MHKTTDNFFTGKSSLVESPLDKNNEELDISGIKKSDSMPNI
jgi:hypothetical protein